MEKQNYKLMNNEFLKYATEIVETLNDFTFESKINVIQNLSIRLVEQWRIKNPEETNYRIIPWELEAFAVFSLFGESGEKLLTRQPETIQIVLGRIRNYLPPYLIDNDDSEFSKLFKFTLADGIRQQIYHENFIFKIYRYLKIFTFKNEKVNMEELFKSYYNCEYERCIEFMLKSNKLFSEHNETVEDHMKFIELCKHYQDVLEMITTDLSDFKIRQTRFTPQHDDYFYGLKMLATIPCIKIEKGILPILPHLFVTALTSSLLFQMTFKIENLRENLGREILENYLFNLLSSITVKDELIPEKKYSIGRNEKRTPDAMLRNGNKVILFDSKSSTPRAALRYATDKEIEQTLKIHVKQVEQAFGNLKNRFLNEYNFFDSSIQLNRDDVYFCIVTLEESYISREEIFNKAAIKMSIPFGSEDYNLMCSRIFILSFNELEDLLFDGTDLFKTFEHYSQVPETWFNIFFRERRIKDKPYVNYDFLKFYYNCKKVILTS